MAASRRQDRRAGPHGVLAVDKPEGPTSAVVTRRLARLLGSGKAGHTGTLDPAATGVLVILLGEATKLVSWAVGQDKEYLATVALGVETDTLDREGVVVRRAPVPSEALDPDRVRALLPAFCGAVEQVPPAYAAIKSGGKSLMSRARKGEKVAPPPRPVVCHALELLAVVGETIELRVHCGSGYYVRALARDLGASLGVPAYLAGLRRTRSGPFSIDQTVAVADVGPDTPLAPLASAVPDVPVVTLDDEGRCDLGHGRPITAALDAPRALAVAADGQPVAMVVASGDGRWKVARGFRF